MISGRHVLLPETIRREHLVHSLVLTSTEMVHTGVVGVVHEVLDRVEPRSGRTLGAGVTARRAAERRRLLRRRVRDEIVALLTAALERVVEAHPVADLVGAGVAEVVRHGIATR